MTKYLATILSVFLTKCISHFPHRGIVLRWHLKFESKTFYEDEGLRIGNNDEFPKTMLTSRYADHLLWQHWLTLIELHLLQTWVIQIKCDKYQNKMYCCSTGNIIEYCLNFNIYFIALFKNSKNCFANCLLESLSHSACLFIFDIFSKMF